MSEITTTNLTDAADEAAIEKANHLAESAATDLYALFDEDKSTFARAKRIMRWVDKGADVKLIASFLSTQRANKTFAGDNWTDEERAQLAELPASKGGVRVANTTISAYVTAWAAVYDTGLVPAEDTVASAFKVKSKGRTAKPLKAMIEDIKSQLESESIDHAEGAVLFVSGCKAILAGRMELDEAKPRGGKGGDDEADGGDAGEVELSADVPMSVEVAIHNLKVILGQEWSDDEFAVIAASVEEALAARTVEV